jgi:hypothetical protein
VVPADSGTNRAALFDQLFTGIVTVVESRYPTDPAEEASVTTTGSLTACEFPSASAAVTVTIGGACVVRKLVEPLIKNRGAVEHCDPVLQQVAQLLLGS